MRAAVYCRFGGPEVVHIEDVPRPEPRATEVLIRVCAATVSAADRRSWCKDVPAGLEHLVGLPEDGQFRPVIDRRYRLTKIVNAHRYVDTNHKRGNVVIDVA